MTADEFLALPSVLILAARDGERLLMRDPTHNIFTVWQGGRLLAKGPERSCRRIFEGKSAIEEFPIKPKPKPEAPAPPPPPKGQLSLF